MANSLYNKSSRTQIYKTLPSNDVGFNGDIILSQIQGRGVYLCSKVNGRWHVSSKMEELRKIENTSTKDLITNKLTVIDNLDIVRISEIASDTDKFLMLDGNTVKFVTGANLLSYSGGQTALTFGISDTNVTKCGAGIVDDDFIRVNGTTFEGRSASEVLSDIGGQASLTFGINNTNAVKIDAADVADDDYARFTANGLEGRTLAEIKSDIGTGNSALVPSAGTSGHFLKHDGTFGQVAYSNLSGTPTVGDGGLTQNNFTDADHTKLNGIEDNATADQTQSDINALGITQVGTISSGTWQGTAIGDSYISSASTWNAKQDTLTFGIANDNAVEIDDADAASGDYAKFTANGLEGRDASQVLSDIGAAALAGSSSQDFATRILTANNHILAKTVVYFDAETANTIGDGATGAIDWTHNQKQKVTITGTGITCNFTNPPGPCNLLLKVVQGDGSDVIGTWDSDIKWAGGTAPTLSNANGAIDILSFYFDGTNYFGVGSLNFS